MLLPLLALLSQDGPTYLGAWASTIHDLDRPVAVLFGENGRLYVAEAGAGRVRAFDRDGVEEAVFRGDLERPAGLALAPDGTLWVSDASRDELVAFAPDGRVARVLGARGRGPGELRAPGGLAASGAALAVADAGNRRVQVFRLDDGSSASFELDALGACRPVDVAWAGEELIVLDADAHELLRLDAQGGRSGALGAFGFPPGLFAAPGGLALAADGLYVADTENHRVQVFDPERVRALVPSLRQSPRYVLGAHAIRPREGRGFLHYPADVAVSADGERLALCEPLDDRVQVFRRASGERPEVDPLRASGGQASPHYGRTLAADGTCLAIVEPETQSVRIFDLRQVRDGVRNDPLQVSVLGGFGEGLGLFRRPMGLDLDLAADGTLLVADPALRRVQEFRLRFDPTAEPEQDFEMARAVRGFLFERAGRSFAGVELDWIPEPVALERASGGEVFVLDAANERVLVLGADLTPLRTFGGHGRGPGSLRGARDLALAPGRVIVAERDNHRLQLFDPESGASLATWGEGSLDEPGGIALGEDGRVWVSDEGTCQVLAFSPGGELVGRHGSKGLGRDQLLRPAGLALSGEGELYVLDHANHRGIVLGPELEFRWAFGSRLFTRPALRPETFPPEEHGE